MKKLDEKRNQRVRIEFEYRNRNFLQHKHPIDGCNVIVVGKTIGQIAQ
ncbi:hypothetical protein ACFLV7_12715 [Chloroflexota bacterium]